MCVKKICPVLVITFLMIQSGSVTAQNNPWELELNLGAYVYQGDLSPQRVGSLKTIRPGIGFSAARWITPLFSVAAVFNWASLKGDEARYSNPEYRSHRAFAFSTSLKELGLHARYFPMGNSAYLPLLEPYAFAGISLAFIHTKKDFSRFDTAYFGETRAAEILAALATDNAQKTKRSILNFPVGAGLRYALNDNWLLYTEANFRLGGSDFIDGFSQSVNPQLKDHFYSQSVGITYKLGGRKKGKGLGCPAVN